MQSTRAVSALRLPLPLGAGLLGAAVPVQTRAENIPVSTLAQPVTGQISLSPTREYSATGFRTGASPSSLILATFSLGNTDTAANTFRAEIRSNNLNEAGICVRLLPQKFCLPPWT